ncbi:F0F1 ATP synthase subunit B [Salinicola sp. MH3R3-1]|uniref:F0F1 ATP synthase subunit delta n=1 Tax=Salinicola sp. MH3R3-1 TaxID=1928762 RepID=UPI00094E4759|nr:F0F1 ATP synthase subunit delta [Salinicola sp. MH3R3-1]OLO09744.1 F0F1 ATP synthase subunit B [Salinicola sp. MH3R3-1]
MLIDWFTVGAQLLNFIVLVWLMKRFLYQPVLNAIAAREQRIAATLADAAATEAEAHRQQREFEQKNQAFEQQRADLLQQATNAATAEGERLRTEAAQVADKASAMRARALATDTEHLHAEIVRRAQQQVFAIARQVLDDLADTNLEQRVCEVFIQRLQAADDEALSALGKALRDTSEATPAVLRSAFELPAAQQTAIQAAIDETAGQTIALKFETEPDLVAGIEISAQGQKLAWSIEDYLSALSSAPHTAHESDATVAA